MGRFVRGARVVPAEAVTALRCAEDHLAAARAEAVSLRESATRRGVEDGEAAAAATLVAALRRREQLLGDFQGDVISLAMDVASKILTLEIESRPEQVVSLFGGALRRLVLAESITLRVHPLDLEVAEAHHSELFSELSETAVLRMLADEGVERGGCVVESDMGRVDARIGTQLEAIEKALRADDE